MEWKALHTRGLPGELQRYKKDDEDRADNVDSDHHHHGSHDEWPEK